MSDKPVLSFTDEDVRRDAARPQLRKGWYFFLNNDVTAKTNEKSGNCALSVRAAPCTEPGDPTTARSPYAFNNLTLPFANPEVPGHQAPNTAGLVLDYLNAVLGDDEVPVCRKNESGEYIYKGKVIPPKGVQRAKEDSFRRMREVAIELWNTDGEALKNCGYYAEVFDSAPTADGTVYRNLRKFSAELPDDATLVDPKEFVELIVGEGDEEAPVAAKKPAPKGRR